MAELSLISESFLPSFFQKAAIYLTEPYRKTKKILLIFVLDNNVTVWYYYTNEEKCYLKGVYLKHES